MPKVYVGDGILFDQDVEPMPRERTELDSLMEEAAYELEKNDD